MRDFRTRAIQLRDAALKVVKARGEWCHSRPTRLLVFQHGELSVLYRTPFQRLPALSENDKYRMALHAGGPYLPHGLAVGFKGKVLDVEWDDNDALRIGTYRPGKWELPLVALATGERTAHDEAWFAVNPGAAACIRTVEDWEYVEAPARPFPVFVAPWLGDWHVERVPFQIDRDQDRIALSGAEARAMLIVMRNAVAGQSYQAAQEHALRLFLNSVITDERNETNQADQNVMVPG